MISRESALKSIEGEHFDVVVIGGGITGAGVALDAASRGYSVALLERGDFAQGTSSRSSKMVHGGLRYLQNFDLGLVREALLERQLMVHLAPHLVYPTPYLVPTLGDARRNRAIGIGLNMYDVMATSRVGRGRSQREEHEAEGEFWSPDRHRTISGEEAAEMVPALAPLEPSSAYLFYDCQTDDARLVLTILGEAQRFGAVLLNGAEVTEILDRDGRATGVAFTEAESGERLEVQATNVVNATGVWADRIRPDEILTEEEVPRIAPSRGTHITLSTDDLPVGDAAFVVPAGEERTVMILPWYGRAMIGPTDNDYDGDIDHVPPSEYDIQYLLDAANEYLELELTHRPHHGRLRGGAPADLGRRPEEVGGHLAQGRAVRDLLGDADDHRRQAHHLAADGRDGRRPDRRARRAPGRVADGRHPAGNARARRGPADQRHPARGRRRPARLPLRARRAAGARPGRGRSGPGRADPAGHPDLLAEVVIAARDEQARSVADVLLRRTRLGLVAASELREAEPVARVAEVLGGELGWSKKRVRDEPEAWRRWSPWRDSIPLPPLTSSRLMASH